MNPKRKFLVWISCIASVAILFYNVVIFLKKFLPGRNSIAFGVPIALVVVLLIFLVSNWDTMQTNERRDLRSLVRKVVNRVIIIAGLFVLVSAIVFILWKIPEYQIARWQGRLDPNAKIDVKDLIQAENSARATIAQILGGLTLLIGLYFTGRNVITSKEGQITDRFTKAIGQLGDVKLEIRLGGIYALERIAKDSKKDRWTIVEVLTAYVREHAKVDENLTSQASQKCPTDVQAIMTVLGRRQRTAEKREYHELDLRGVNLRGADLSEAHLERASLEGSYLEGARLVCTYLKEASLANAHLQKANLLCAHLEGANLRAANLTGATLALTYLKGATLGDACLEGAYVDTELTPEQLRAARIDATTRFSAHRQATMKAGIGQE